MDRVRKRVGLRGGAHPVINIGGLTLCRNVLMLAFALTVKVGRNEMK